MNNPETIKFYILIPTRERPATLLQCLRTIINQNYTNFQIIVSDNFSQDNTKEVVASLGDPRILYLNTGKRIGMTSNFEYALSHTNTGWVTILGDDDGLLPGALERVAEIIRDTGTEAISSTWCQYVWPGCSGMASILTLPLRKGWERRNSLQWLSKLMRGEAEYPELPMLYTGGFVSTEAINRARDHERKFYKSLNPDVYSAIAIATVLDNYIHLNEPIAIAGTSAHSNGVACLGKEKDAKLSEIFFSENDHTFHATLSGQKVRSIPIIVYESYLQASFLHCNTLNVSLINQLSLAVAYAHNDQRAEIISYCQKVANNNNVEIADLSRNINKLTHLKKLKKSLRMLTRISTWFYKLNNVTYDANSLGLRNVFDASIAAHAIWFAHLKNQNWRLKKIVHALKRRFH